MKIRIKDGRVVGSSGTVGRILEDNVIVECTEFKTVEDPPPKPGKSLGEMKEAFDIFSLSGINANIIAMDSTLYIEADAPVSSKDHSRLVGLGWILDGDEDDVCWQLNIYPE